MKKLTLISILLLLSISAVWAAPNIRLTGLVSFDAITREGTEDMQIEVDETITPFFGFGWELLPNNRGLGGDFSVRFYEITNDWVLDWNANVYLSYHLFGNRAFLDPFVQVGFAVIGRVGISDNDIVYVQASDDVRNLNITFYPFVTAGLGIVLGEGETFGVKLSYRPVAAEIPFSPIEGYPLTNLQLTVYAGMSLGAFDW